MRFQSIGTDALLSTFHLYRHQSRGFLPLPCPCHAARETCPPKVSLKPRQSSRHVSECLQICALTAQHLDSRGKVRMQSNMMLSGEETTAVGCMWLRERASSWVKSPNNRSNEHNMPAKHISSKTNTRAFVRTLMHRWRSYATHTLCSRTFIIHLLSAVSLSALSNAFLPSVAYATKYITCATQSPSEWPGFLIVLIT